MMHQLIRSFGYENFGSDYHVAPQGHNEAIQPLALIAKENLSYWRRATGRRPPKIVLENLEAYITSDETVRSKVFQALKGGLHKDLVLTVPSSGTSVGASAQIEGEFGDGLGVHANRSIILGELNLSSVQEEYYGDMSLREILSNAKLDPAKMKPYEKKKLYIITGVVYSEILQIDGKREEGGSIGAHVQFFPRLQWINRLTNFKVGMSWTDNPAPPVGRNDRSPLLYTFAKVKYNQESFCLELQQLVGAGLKRRGILDVEADSSAADSLCLSEVESVIITTKEQWIYEDLMESSKNKTEKKLQVVTRFLEETDSLSELDLRTRKYVNLVDTIMKTDKMALRTETPFSAKDLNLLQATGVEIEQYTLNNSKVLRITAHNQSMVLEFDQIFHHLQEMQDKEWKLLKEFSENRKDMVDGKKYEDTKQEDEPREELTDEKENCKDVKNENTIIEEEIGRGETSGQESRSQN